MSSDFSLFMYECECVHVIFNSAPAARLAGTHTAAVSGAGAVCGAAADRPACGARAPPHASHPEQRAPPCCSLRPMSPSQSRPEAVASAGRPETSSLSDSPARGKRHNSVCNHMRDTKCTRKKYTFSKSIELWPGGFIAVYMDRRRPRRISVDKDIVPSFIYKQFVNIIICVIWVGLTHSVNLTLLCINYLYTSIYM